MQTQLITLTSDFGTSDGSVMLLKLAISNHLSNVVFTDVSHTIKPYQITHAAYLVSNLYHQFEEGTIHCIMVNVFANKDFELKAVRYKNHFFVGVDNGIFSYLLKNENAEAITFGNIHEAQFFYQHIAKSITQLTELKNTWNDLPKLDYYKIANTLFEIKSDSITGRIWMVDEFGNLITNIHRQQIEHIIADKKINISYGYKALLQSIEANLFDAKGFEPVAYFNQFGYLEIAIKNHNISKLFSLHEGGIVKITYA